MGTIKNKKMKFVSLFVAIAAAALVQKDGEKKAATPQDSHDAMTSTRDTSRSVVAEQNRFEAELAAMHASNMANADNAAQTLKNSVRAAREKQKTETNQIPAMKTYGDK